MDKAVAVVLTLLVVVAMLDAVALVTAEKPLIMPKTRLEPITSTKGDIKPAVTCPDGGSCSTGNTCCLHINGAFACCPDANGNCCFDYSTCCNSGYVCDSANNSCVKAGLPADVLDKLPFLRK